jgi:hypothetical protein
MFDILTGTRKRVYAQFALALMGLFEVINPSRAPIWDAVKDIAVVLGG